MPEPEEKQSVIKTFETFMVVNWRTGEIAVYKRQPRLDELGPALAFKLRISVTLPRRDVPVIDQTVVMSDPSVARIVMEEL